MKKHYKKIIRYRAQHVGDYRYELRHGGYHRAVKTFVELRQNDHDRVDARDDRRPLPFRACRSNGELNAYNDFNIARNYGRSWKSYTRHRKQWMVSRDAKPSVNRILRRSIFAELFKEFDLDYD